jgi:predicted transcriptional regulator
MSWFDEMCDEMRGRYGERGWKRRLAEMLGVSDSNVQNWIRAGDAPPIVRTAYEAIDENHDLRKDLEDRENDDFIIQALGENRGFKVLRCNKKTGNFEELATTHSDVLARAIVHIASGALDKKISDLVYLVSALIPDECDQKYILKLQGWNEPLRREKMADVIKIIENEGI